MDNGFGIFTTTSYLWWRFTILIHLIKIWYLFIDVFLTVVIPKRSIFWRWVRLLDCTWIIGIVRLSVIAFAFLLDKSSTLELSWIRLSHWPSILTLCSPKRRWFFNGMSCALYSLASHYLLSTFFLVYFIELHNRVSVLFNHRWQASVVLQRPLAWHLLHRLALLARVLALGIWMTWLAGRRHRSGWVSGVQGACFVAWVVLLSAGYVLFTDERL